MPRALPILGALFLSACNVFFPLNSVEPDGAPNATTNATTNATANAATNAATNGGTAVACDTGCTCEKNCTASCADSCDVKCEGTSICDGEVGGDSTVLCEGDSECLIACTGTSCEFTCTERGSRCEPDCPSGTACILRCGGERNEPQQAKCTFQSCAGTVEDCGGGVFACGTSCP